MKLTHRIVECRAKRTFRISQGASDVFRMVVCEIRHGEVVGYGEASPSKRVSGETLETVGAFLDRRAPEIAELAPARWESHLARLHADPVAPAGATSREQVRDRAEPSARAAIDLAIHDLVGKLQEVPVRALYGLPRARLETCMTVSLDEPAVMAEEARGYHAGGFGVLKLKLGHAADDAARVEAVRKAVPHARLRADANTGWTRADAERLAPRLAAMGVEFLEQPFPPAQDAELASFSRESPLPMYADESVMDGDDVRRLHALGFRGGVNLKLQKTGGIRPAVEAIREARASGYHVQLGCNVETAIGIAAGVQLLGALDHADLDGHLLLRDEPFRGPMPASGWYETTDAPGLGVRAS